MRVRALGILVLLSLLAAVQAAPKRVLGMFWKAEGPKGTVYLLGSIHIGTKEMYPLPVEIESAFKTSKGLIVEIDDRPESREEIYSYIRNNALYTGGDNLYKHLPSAYADKMRKFAEANNLSAERISLLKPWVAMLMTGLLPQLQSGAVATDLGVDEHFLKEARGVGKPILPVETPRSQVDLLANIPEKTQIEMLELSLDHPTSGEFGKRMDKGWSGGDVKLMQRGTAGLDLYPLVSYKLIEERNVRMADFADALAERGGRYFMVVGAGHMVGQYGIVNLLRQRGYRITSYAKEP